VTRDEMMREKGFAAAPQVARVCKVHLQTVYRWIADGEVDSVEVQHRRYIPVDDVLKRYKKEEREILGITKAVLLGEPEQRM
jgi:predicted site-specific integrase-resolvase